MDKDCRKKSHYDEDSSSCSHESWEQNEHMCCPYIYTCPIYMGCGKKREADEDQDTEDMMRSPMYHHGHGRRPRRYPYYPYYYPYYPYYYPYNYPYYKRPGNWWY